MDNLDVGDLYRPLCGLIIRVEPCDSMSYVSVYDTLMYVGQVYHNDRWFFRWLHKDRVIRTGDPASWDGKYLQKALC